MAGSAPALDRAGLGGRLELDHHLVDIAPAPAFRRIIAFDDRMLAAVKMLGGVLAARLVAAQPAIRVRRSKLPSDLDRCMSVLERLSYQERSESRRAAANARIEPDGATPSIGAVASTPQRCRVHAQIRVISVSGGAARRHAA